MAQHEVPNRSNATVMSRLVLLDRRFPADFEKLKVCVQGTRDLPGDAVLFESKLAYAAWLSASGLNSEALFDRIEWTVAERCSVEDTAYGSVIIMGDLEKPEAGQELTTRFAPAELHCQKSGLQSRCSSSLQTLGLGSTGSLINYFYPATPDRWIKVENAAPASVVLSPYVTWTPLEQELSSQGAQRDRILEAKGRVTALTYPECQSLAQALSEAKLEGQPDKAFQGLFEGFMKGEASALDTTYRSSYSAFHVLLHEIGHQFGMDHADNPSLDSETGSVGESKQRGNQWITEIATMAYGVPYLYLTYDDRTGVADLALKLKSYLGERTRP